MSKILKLDKLSVGYKNKVILKNLNAEVKKGSVISIVGKNGVGKSTLLKTILGLIPAISGDIYLDDKLNRKYSNKQRARKISAVLTRNTPSFLNVEEFIALGRTPHQSWYAKTKPIEEKQIDKMIKIFELEDIRQQSVSTLSDGQLQKVHIARAMVQDTPVIVLDEPSAHLDLNNKFEIFSILHKLSEITKKTIILSTHELELSLQFSDEIWYITRGNLVVGSPEEIAYKYQLLDYFSNEKVNFDFKEGRYVFRKKKIKNIAIQGEGELFYWAKHLARRMNIGIDENSQIQIKVEKNIEVKSKGEIFELQDLKDLKEYLQHIT